MAERMVDATDVLAEFGATGRVGLIERGVRLQDLVTVYGEPWEIGRIDAQHRWPFLYSYGDVEFVVCRCRIVNMISIPTWRATLELPQQSEDLATTLRARLTYAEMTGALTAAGCKWEPLTEVEGQRGLRIMPQRIEFVFTATDDDLDFVLHSAATWWHTHECGSA